MSQSSVVHVLRRLLQEIRKITPSRKLKDALIVPFILKESRKYQITDTQLCKQKNEMVYLADSYRCYLESSRRYRELLEKYQGKGERSIKQTADMVGFKLPHDPK